MEKSIGIYKGGKFKMRFYDLHLWGLGLDWLKKPGVGSSKSGLGSELGHKVENQQQRSEIYGGVFAF